MERCFDPLHRVRQDQRVTQAEIAKNKRLGAVLEHIKVEQDQAVPKTVGR